MSSVVAEKNSLGNATWESADWRRSELVTGSKFKPPVKTPTSYTNECLLKSRLCENILFLPLLYVANVVLKTEQKLYQLCTLHPVSLFLSVFYFSSTGPNICLLQHSILWPAGQHLSTQDLALLNTQLMVGVVLHLNNSEEQPQTSFLVN